MVDALLGSLKTKQYAPIRCFSVSAKEQGTLTPSLAAVGRLLTDWPVLPVLTAGREGHLLRRFDCALSTSANSGLRNRRAHSGAVRNLSARTRGVAFIALVVLKISRQMLLSTGARHFN